MSLTNFAYNSIHMLDEWESKELLLENGITVPQQRLVTTVEEAVDAANEIGYPVVLKRVSEIHKSDTGGVRIGLQTPFAVAEAMREMLASVRTKMDSPIQRFSVQQCLPTGVEMLLTVRRDTQFGLSLLLGRGGTEVELWQDISYRLWPTSKEDLRDQLRSLRTSRAWMEEWRGNGPQIDVGALWSLLQQLHSMFMVRPSLFEIELNPVLFWGTGKGLGIADARIAEYDAIAEGSVTYSIGKQLHPSLPGRPSLEVIQALFHPKRIAIIGATEDSEKLGGRLARYIKVHGFPGDIAYVNPHHQGRIGWYASLSDVPHAIDVALVAVPFHHVQQVLAECRTCRVPAAIVYTSGFAETGAEGRQRQEALLQATQGEVRIVGPNSMGIVSQTDDCYLGFGMTLEMENPPKGNIGVISQSGALSSCLVGRLWESGVGCSRWITTGNEADLTISDFLIALVDDPATSVIGLFIETIRDVAGFEAAARRALVVGKPIVVLKAGRTAQARKAIESHTGSLAGEDALYDDFFRRLGILRCIDFTEFSNTLLLLSRYIEMSGRRIGVVSTSGGANSLVADEMARKGLEMSVFSADTVTILSQLIDDFGSIHNPVDVTVQLTVHPETLGPVIETIAADSFVDGLLVVLTTNSDPPAAVMAEIVAAQMPMKKPMVLVRMGPVTLAPRAMSVYQSHGIPVFSTPEQGVSCLANLASYAEFRRRAAIE